MINLIKFIEENSLVLIPLILILLRPGSILLFIGALIQIIGFWLKVPAIVMLVPILLALLIPFRKSEPLNFRTPALPLIIIFIFGSYTRLYGIENLAISGENDFGWETPFGFMVSSSWDSVVNFGLKQPQISQGFLWHLCYFLLHHFSDNALVSGRYFFSIMSILNIGLVFIVSRKLFGSSVAVIIAAVFAFSPLEPAWARSNYGMTLATFVSLITVWSLFVNRWVSVCFSFLTMLSYPAATLSGLLPIFKKRFLVIPFWFLAPSLIAFAWINPLSLHASDRSIFNSENPLKLAFNNLCSLVEKYGAYSKGDEYFDLSVIEPGFLIGRVGLLFFPFGLWLLRKEKLLAVWLGLSLVTAFTSIDVIPRRFCTFVAPVSIYAGYGFSVFLGSLGKATLPIAYLSIIFMGSLSHISYFRHRENPQTFAFKIAELIKSELTKNQLVVLDNVHDVGRSISIIFTDLEDAIKEKSYLTDSHTIRSSGGTLELNNKLSLASYWYSHTKYRDMAKLTSVSKIVWISPGLPPEDMLANGIEIRGKREVQIDWLRLHVYELF